jgi:hypothetical protein
MIPHALLLILKLAANFDMNKEHLRQVVLWLIIISVVILAAFGNKGGVP